MLFVNEKYQDVILEKNHIAYIFSSPEYLAREPPIIKFGVSDKPSRRLREHQCSCPTGLYYSQIMTYNSIASERSIKMMLEAILLKFKPNSSGADEWYEISSLDRAKEILNQVISNTNNEYENVLTERQKLRESLI